MPAMSTPRLKLQPRRPQAEAFWGDIENIAALKTFHYCHQEQRP